MTNYKDNYYIPRFKKVKHVHFIKAKSLVMLENLVNEFADQEPDRKILGIKLTVNTNVGNEEYIATITYLKNVDNINKTPYIDDRNPEYDEDY